MTAKPRLGIQGADLLLTGPESRRREFAERIVRAGIDHLFTADHISFHGGTGMDGLINASMMLARTPDLEVCVGVYLLALRHPLPVARQLATISEAAPGRLILGVGVGGEDRHEIEICGVDPATRGRRTDAALAALQGLLSGEPCSHRDEFFDFEDARILPAPGPPVPILIGGRADAALERTARFGDGWLGVWCSAPRFADALADVARRAERHGRERHPFVHGLQLWAGIDDDPGRARTLLAQRMEAFYRVPFERFERYAPCGRPEDIADFLAPYVDAGARRINLMPVTRSPEAAIDAAGEIARLLRDRA